MLAIAAEAMTSELACNSTLAHDAGRIATIVIGLMPRELAIRFQPGMLEFACDKDLQ